MHRWIKTDPAFRAAHNIWGAEALELAHSRAVAAQDSAMSTLTDDGENGSVPAALALAKSLGVLGARSEDRGRIPAFADVMLNVT